jgi:hypothetical protein
MTFMVAAQDSDQSQENGSYTATHDSCHFGSCFMMTAWGECPTKQEQRHYSYSSKISLTRRNENSMAARAPASYPTQRHAMLYVGQ